MATRHIKKEYKMEFELGQEFDESAGSGFTDLRETGLYDVTLKSVGYTVTKNGAVQLNIKVNAGGEYDDIFYQGNIKNINGSEGFEMKKLLNPLAFICGVKALSTSTETVQTKNGTKEVHVFDQFTECPIKIAVQKTWSDYRNDWEKKIVKVFDANGRTASEIKAGEEAKQIRWYLSDKFQDKGPKGKTTSKKEVPEVDFSDDFDVF